MGIHFEKCDCRPNCHNIVAVEATDENDRFRVLGKIVPHPLFGLLCVMVASGSDADCERIINAAIESGAPQPLSVTTVVMEQFPSKWAHAKHDVNAN